MSSLDSLKGAKPDFSIEKTFLSRGCRYIAGVDEAGRGALAGPLSVAMVIYDHDLYDSTLHDLGSVVTDSKQLTQKKRVEARLTVESLALAYAGIFIPHTVIDTLGINRATELAVKKLLASINTRPDLVIMDGNFKFNPGVPFHSFVKGDCRSLSIASASILAKVARDNIMCRVEKAFPGYGFAKHKGYGTRSHMEAIRTLGLCPIHRKSYEPARGMLEAQGALFDEDNRIQ